jgi:hypothetical protein
MSGSAKMEVPVRVRLFFLAFGLLAAGPAWAQTQPAARQAPNVGASEIFAALTQPDRPAELATLRQLRESLSAGTDPKSLEDARAQLDALLQAEEHRQSDMPPALVMSAIASRIDNAIAALEATRPAPLPAPARQPPWLVPGLAGAAGTLALGLLAALVALATRGAQPDETDDVRELVAKILRRLDASQSSSDHAHDHAETAAEEASVAAHDAAITVSRLSSAAKEAESRLLGCVEEVETRLRAQMTPERQFEQAIDSLPDRLANLTDALEARGSALIESIGAELAEGMTAVKEAAAALPAAQAGLRDTITSLSATATTQATHVAEALARLERLGQALPEAATSLAASSAELQAQAARVARGAGPGPEALGEAATLVEQVGQMVTSLPDKFAETVAAATTELTHAIDSLHEMRSLSATHAARLEEVMGRSEKLSASLPGLTEALTSVASLLQQNAEAAQSGRETIATTETLCGQISALAASLPNGIAEALQIMESRGMQAIEAARAQMAGSAELLAKAAETVPATQAALQETASALTQTATAHVAGLAEVLPRATEALTAASNGLQDQIGETRSALEAGRAALAHAAEAANEAAAETRGSAAELAKAVIEAATLPEALHALHDIARLMAAESRALTDAARARAQSSDQMADKAASVVQGVLSAADCVLESAARMNAVLENAASARAHAELDSEEAQAAQSNRLAHTLDTLIANATAAIGAAPAEASALSAAATQLREDARTLRETASRIEQENAQCMGAASMQIAPLLRALESACQRLEERAADTTDCRVGDASADVLRSQTERIAKVLDASEHIAARLQAAADREAAPPETLARISGAAEEAHLAGLADAIDSVQSTAAKLHLGALAQEAALSQVVQAANVVAEAALQSPPNAGLGRLSDLATEAASLQSEAETLAAAALRGETVSMPGELVAQTPALLAAIEISIHRLQGTATALALASDAQRKAA